MKIKYIKNAPQGLVGEVKTVKDYEGRVLVKLGFAELFEQASNSKQKSNSKSNSKSSEKDLLLKPNGEPVIDDFGNNVEIKSAVKQKGKK